MPVIVEEKQTTQSITTALFVEAWVESGWSFNGIESRRFKKFISCLKNLWHIPSRYDISSVHLPRLSSALDQKFRENVRASLYSNLSIEFDHWEDANHRSFLGIIATSNSGRRYLLDLRDVSLKGHSSSVIVLCRHCASGADNGQSKNIYFNRVLPLEIQISWLSGDT